MAVLEAEQLLHEAQSHFQGQFSVVLPSPVPSLVFHILETVLGPQKSTSSLAEYAEADLGSIVNTTEEDATEGEGADVFDAEEDPATEDSEQPGR
ncbi:unnamed protein product, partial [Amoebophrya sp. A25]|eukprot:GSA25T00006792001.1